MFNGKQLKDLNTKDLTIEDLKQILSDARRAAKYALDHYDELIRREAAHTLYGPFDYFLGAAIPGKSVSMRSRALTLKTSRKKYLIYELDGEYKLLRVKQVFNPGWDLTYHCVELEGVMYAFAFEKNQKEIWRNEIFALAHRDGKPYFYGSMTEDREILHAEFYEYVSPEKVLVTGYYYNPISIYSWHGDLIDPEAPLGELNSAAHSSCWEEKPMYTDFSKYFRETETVEQKEEESEKHRISDWIDRVLNTDIPDDVVAFCFNLYEDGNGVWSMELIGSSRFDPEDSDWPCDEITDFNSRNNPYEWEMDCSWEDILAYMVGELKDYFANGKCAELLKSRSGVGVGFVDGDIEILS